MNGQTTDTKPQPIEYGMAVLLAVGIFVILLNSGLITFLEDEANGAMTCRRVTVGPDAMSFSISRCVATQQEGR